MEDSKAVFMTTNTVWAFESPPRTKQVVVATKEKKTKEKKPPEFKP